MNKNHVVSKTFIHILFVCLFSFPPQTVHGQDTEYIDPNRIEAFADAFFGTHMADMHVPGAVFVVVEDGRVVFSKGYGYSHLENNKPVIPEQTLFRVGSVSKLFTATAVMQLHEQGLLDLNEDINVYLKRVKIPATYPEPVTLTHLLTHSAGFDSRTIGTLSRSETNRPALGDHLANRMPPRVRPSGTVISYCNYSIALAGYVVEVVSGMPFEQYIQEHIFQPLQMRHSSFQPHPDVPGDLAVGYLYEPPDIYRPAQVEYLNIPPAGLLTATAMDMANFMIAHLQYGRFGNTQIVKEETARQMHQRQFAHHPQLPGWCYGFNENFKNGHRTIGHAGGISGIWSYLLLVPDEQTGFFMSQNGGGNFLAPVLIEAFMNAFFPGIPKTFDTPVQQSPSIPLRMFVGRYRFTCYPHTTLGKLQVLLGIPEVDVRLHATNQLMVQNYHSGHIRVPPGPYIQIAPLLFRESDGKHLIAFHKNKQGPPAYFLSDAHWDAISYERLSWYDRSIVHVGLLVFCSLIYLSACIIWPVGALIRHVRKKHAVVTLPLKGMNRRARQARLWAGGTCVLALTMLVALVLHLYLSPPALAYGELGAIPFLLVLPLITTALTVCLFVFLFLSWKEKFWSLFGRLYYTLVVMAVAFFILFLWYWNLLGFNY